MDKTDWSDRENSFFYFLTFVCVSVSIPGVVVAGVEVNGKLVGADSLPQRESQGSNPGHQEWQQTPFPAEPSC